MSKISENLQTAQLHGLGQHLRRTQDKLRGTLKIRSAVKAMNDDLEAAGQARVRVPTMSTEEIIALSAGRRTKHPGSKPNFIHGYPNTGKVRTNAGRALTRPVRSRGKKARYKRVWPR